MDGARAMHTRKRPEFFRTKQCGQMLQRCHLEWDIHGMGYTWSPARLASWVGEGGDAFSVSSHFSVFVWVQAQVVQLVCPQAHPHKDAQQAWSYNHWETCICLLIHQIGGINWWCWQAQDVCLGQWNNRFCSDGLLLPSGPGQALGTKAQRPCTGPAESLILAWGASSELLLHAFACLSQPCFSWVTLQELNQRHSTERHLPWPLSFEFILI